MISRVIKRRNDLLNVIDQFGADVFNEDLCMLPDAAYSVSCDEINSGVKVGMKYSVFVDGSRVNAFYSELAGTSSSRERVWSLVLDLPTDTLEQARRFQKQIVAALEAA